MKTLPLNFGLKSKVNKTLELYKIILNNSSLSIPSTNPAGYLCFTNFAGGNISFEGNTYLRYGINKDSIGLGAFNIVLNDNNNVLKYYLVNQLIGESANNFSGTVEIFRFHLDDTIKINGILTLDSSNVVRKRLNVLDDVKTDDNKGALIFECISWFEFKANNVCPRRSFNEFCDNIFADENCKYSGSGETSMSHAGIEPRNGAYKTITLNSQNSDYPSRIYINTASNDWFSDSNGINYDYDYINYTLKDDAQNEERKITDINLIDKYITLNRPFTKQYSSGETLKLIFNCDRTRQDCVKYDNILNFVGYPSEDQE